MPNPKTKKQPNLTKAQNILPPKKITGILVGVQLPVITIPIRNGKVRKKELRYCLGIKRRDTFSEDIAALSKFSEEFKEEYKPYNDHRKNGMSPKSAIMLARHLYPHFILSLKIISDENEVVELAPDFFAGELPDTETNEENSSPESIKQ